MAPTISAREPRQDRGVKTLRRILDATERLLETKSFEQITVRGILVAARVTAGSFYARFESKEALFKRLWERQQAAMDDLYAPENVKALDHADLEERVRFVVRHRLARYRKHRALFRTTILRNRCGSNPASADDRRAYSVSSRRLVRFLMKSSDEIRHPQPEKGIVFGEFAVSAVCREMVIFPEAPHARAARQTDQQLERYLTRMYLDFLRDG